MLKIIANNRVSIQTDTHYLEVVVNKEDKSFEIKEVMDLKSSTTYLNPRYFKKHMKTVASILEGKLW